MKKFISLFLILITFIFGFQFNANAEWADMWAYVYTWDGKMNADGTMALTRATTGITFKVLAVDADTAETCYLYDTLTAQTNPFTTTHFESGVSCNDQVRFRVDPTDSSNDRYVDLIVVDTNGGYTAFVENFDKYTHSIIIDERPNIQHHLCIWFSASDNSETDTGIDFDYDTAIHNVIVEVVTVDATETIDVGILSTGTNGDPNGLIAAASVATAGYINPKKPTITAGSNETYISTASVVGALMGSTLAGSDAVEDEGSAYLWDHVVLSANEQSLTYTGSAGSDTAAGYIHIFFTRTR